MICFSFISCYYVINLFLLNFIVGIVEGIARRGLRSVLIFGNKIAKTYYITEGNKTSKLQLSIYFTLRSLTSNCIIAFKFITSL